MPEILIKTTDQGLQVASSTDIAGNLALALGLLEVAKIALIDQARANERYVQPVSMIPPGLN